MQSDPLGMLGEFKKFLSSGITPQKAEEIIREKINSGAMSQEQFENLKAQAQQLQSFLSFLN